MSSWTPDRLAVAYDERLLGWRLGEGHPTDPIRATLCLEALARAGVAFDVEPITAELKGELQQIHDRDYVQATLSGHNAEWSGVRPDLGSVAAHMFTGTVQLVRAVNQGRVAVGFSPQGAKHHAMADRGAGFCVFNDMAWAGTHFAAQGKRVLYVDLDAHHGDGVEVLTRHDDLVMTCSVHDSTIFPGTGHVDEPSRQVFNHPLPRGAGDQALLAAVRMIVGRGRSWQPDVLLVAIGADGHETDPLSSLTYTYGGYERAAELLGKLAAGRGIPVLMGGAGATSRGRTHPRCGRSSWPASPRFCSIYLRRTTPTARM